MKIQILLPTLVLACAAGTASAAVATTTTTTTTHHSTTTVPAVTLPRIEVKTYRVARHPVQHRHAKKPVKQVAKAPSRSVTTAATVDAKQLGNGPAPGTTRTTTTTTHSSRSY